MSPLALRRGQTCGTGLEVRIRQCGRHFGDHIHGRCWCWGDARPLFACKRTPPRTLGLQRGRRSRGGQRLGRRGATQLGAPLILDTFTQLGAPLILDTFDYAPRGLAGCSFECQDPLRDGLAKKTARRQRFLVGEKKTRVQPLGPAPKTTPKPSACRGTSTGPRVARFASQVLW